MVNGPTWYRIDAQKFEHAGSTDARWMYEWYEAMMTPTVLKNNVNSNN